MTNVELFCVRGEVPEDALKAAGGKLSGVAKAERVNAKREALVIKGVVSGPKTGSLSLTVQAIITTSNGQTITTTPQFIKKMPTLIVSQKGGSFSRRSTGPVDAVPGSNSGGSNAKSGDPKAPAEAEALSGEKWWPVRLVRAEDKRYRVHYLNLGDDADEWLPLEKVRFPTWSTTSDDVKVEAKLNNQWLKAIALERDGSRTKVHYLGWSAKNDEWLESDRVRTLSAEANVRTWTDATGKYKVEATFVELANGKVKLKTTEGKVITMPVEKLSAADKAEAEKLAAAKDDNPFKDSPFKESP